MNPYILLFIAIISEVVGSSLLKAADGFKKLAPSLGVIFGYISAFYFFSLTLRSLPLGMSYAIWSGVGTGLTAVVGILIYKEEIHRKKVLGLILIIIGVFILNVTPGGA